MSTNAPIFILGTNRSGTSALHLALLSALQHKGYGEGHFFETILGMKHCADSLFDSDAAKIKGTFMGNITREDMTEGLYSLYAGIYRKYLGESFIDKTPTYAAIESSPLINRVFPSARIIYLQRRGIENVASKQRKFPDQGFANACNAWKSCIHCWRVMKKNLPNFLEIDQYNLRYRLEDEVLRLQDYLELTPAEADTIVSFLTEEKVEKTSPDTIPSIDSVGFNDEEKAIFMKICAETLNEEGYSLTESYFINAKQ